MNTTLTTNTIQHYSVGTLTLVIIYHILNSVGFLYSVFHIAIILKISHPPRHGGKIYKIIILTKATGSLIFSCLQLAAGSLGMPTLTNTHKELCAVTVWLRSSCFLLETTCLMPMAIDRYLAIKWLKLYWETFFVRYFVKVFTVIIVMFIGYNALVYGIYRQQEFPMEISNIGICSTTSGGFLVIGLSATELAVSSAFCFALIVRTNKLTADGALRMTQAGRALNQLVFSVLIGNFISWSPGIPTLVARFRGIECHECEWLASLALAFPPLLNPTFYYIQRQRYRQKLYDWTIGHCFKKEGRQARRGETAGACRLRKATLDYLRQRRKITAELSEEWKEYDPSKSRIKVVIY